MTGKRALLIGVSYAAPPEDSYGCLSPVGGVLTGSHEDVGRISRLLQDSYNFSNKDIDIMLDSPLTLPPDRQPNRQNIVRLTLTVSQRDLPSHRAFSWMVLTGLLKACLKRMSTLCSSTSQAMVHPTISINAVMVLTQFTRQSNS